MTAVGDPELSAWADLPTTAISDALGRRQVLSARIRPVTGIGIVARAFCARVVAGDSASLHLALEHIPAGAVLVVDAGGFQDRAVWGEILTVAAQQRGVIGAVIDGAIRDSAAITRRGFIVYAGAVTSAGPHKAGGGDWGGVVSCAGVPVTTGDLIVADEDGVVAVPWGQRDTVAAETRAILEREGRLMERVSQGESTAVLLGLKRSESAVADSLDESGHEEQ